METATTSGEQRIILKIGLDTLDMTDYPPLTQGDKKALRREPFALDVRKMGEWTEEEESKFVLFLLKRIREATTIAEIDALPAKIVQDLAGYCMRRSAQVDSPFSRRLTSSLPSTAGEKPS